MSNRPTIALLVETSTTWGSGIVRGISNYAIEKGGWNLYLEPRGRYEELELPPGWRGDGIIARVTTPAMAEQVIDWKLPAVDVSWFNFGEGAIARCTANTTQAGEAAAKHLLERGFRHFAYVAALHRPVSHDLLMDSYQATIKAAGYQCSCYSNEEQVDHPKDWIASRRHLGEWLKELPKPCGLLAWNAIRGRQVVEACRNVDVNIPEQIAVIGGEEDELTCSISNPSLSTVDLNPLMVGYEAARLLDQMIQGVKVPETTVRTDIGGVMTRHSTDILAIEDRMLAEALRCIRDQAYEGVTITDILRDIPMARRQLELKCKKLLGRSPAAEIRRMRIQRAKQLLKDTDLSIPKVATASGFREPTTMSRTFRRELGETPSEFRKRESADKRLF